MGRVKGIPIDVRRFKSNTEDVSVVLDPSFIIITNDGITSRIQKIAQKNDWIDLKSTWISQALLGEAEWYSNKNKDGTARDPQEQREMRSNIRIDKLRERFHQGNKRTRKYMVPNGATRPLPPRPARIDVNYPKQLAYPPVNNTHSQLAIRSRGRTFNGRMSLLKHWKESRSRTKTGIESESASSKVMMPTRISSGGVPEGGMAQPRHASRILPKATIQSKSSSRIAPVKEEIGLAIGGTMQRSVAHSSMSDFALNKPASKVKELSSSEESDHLPPSQKKRAPASATARKASAAEESDYFMPPSQRKRAPAPPARPASAAMTVSIRACISCYERHSGCDRGLPGCSSCKNSNLICVYPDVSVKKSSKKRRRR